MPHKPKKPCAAPGCPALVPAGERFCPAHAKAAAATYERYERDPAVRRRYGRTWRRIRAAFIAAHPLCAVCEREGRLTPAAEVHHVLPLSKGGTHDAENLMALCKACHSAITARGRELS
jgi:5-methylcytosine-specific restriction protein A